MVVTLHFVGFHPRLILEGFEEIRKGYPIESVYLLYDGKQDRYGKVSLYNARRLERVLSFFKPVLLRVNPISFSDVFRKVYAVLRVETGDRGRKVLVDITDMPPIMSAAVSVAAMMFEGVSIYAVQADKRGEFIPEPTSPDFEEWVERKDSSRMAGISWAALPGTRLDAMGGDEPGLVEHILSTLYEKRGRAGSIKQLIEWCGYSGDDPVMKTRFSRKVKELSRKGFVRVIYKGKSREIELTEFGRAYIEALREAERLSGRRAQPLVEALEV